MDDKELESQPDLTVEDRKALTARDRFFTHLSKEVNVSSGYIPLLACCFVTGLTDGTLYNAYGTFVSMQTGNTIFVALGASHQNTKPYGWARSLCSIGCFAIGCFVFARIHKMIGGARLRCTLITSFFLQTVCVMLAAALIQSNIIDGTYPSPRPASDIDFKELAAVALLSAQAGGQIVNSRGLGVSEVPTVVITSLICDLVMDESLFVGFQQNPKRNRRAIAFVLTLLGAICGGWISKATRAVQPSLWIVSALLIGALLDSVTAYTVGDFVPSCAVSCLNDGITSATPCSNADLTCVCEADNYRATYTASLTCVLDACGADVSLGQVLPGVENMCEVVLSTTFSGASTVTTPTPATPASTAIPASTTSADTLQTATAAPAGYSYNVATPSSCPVQTSSITGVAWNTSATAVPSPTYVVVSSAAFDFQLGKKLSVALALAVLLQL
ncbi:hypothetical protein BX600DRAFT_518098 [Xylariales sp. PMI_506]|nr:hypothetical protein BX600DRAFT_518098 [Xylariales sp. PMI_506]